MLRRRKLGGLTLVLGSAAALAMGGAATGSASTTSAPPVPQHDIGMLAPGPQAHLKGGVTRIESDNWSGYAWEGSADGKFTAARSYWTVPSVISHDSGTEYCFDWVGIDGAFNNDMVVQDGTEEDNNNGTPYYSAWTEIYPANEVRITSFTIKAGDKMEGIVQETATNKWSLTVKNLTTAKSYTRKVSFTTPGQDVEWVHERPGVNGSLSTLADTSNVSFAPDTYSTAAIGKSPVWEKLNKTVPGATLDQIFMYNNSYSTVIASPSVLNSGGNGFAVAYGSKSPPP
jgi:Peptidase A4 family